EAIADLRAATGTTRIELTYTAPPAVAVPSEPILPAPSPQESVEALVTAAKAVDNSADRAALLGAALVALEKDKDALATDWVASPRAGIERVLTVERRVDRSYRTMTRTTLAVADRRARMADVRGLERLLTRIDQRDRFLGARRPEAVNALVAAVQEK